MLLHKYRWNETSYGDLFRMCLALTNCHVKNTLLRQAGTVDLVDACNRLSLVSNEQMEVRRASQEKNARDRRDCMAGFVKHNLFAQGDSD